MKIFVTILIFISFNLNANEEKLREWTYTNTIDDILGCGAYYLITSIGLERKNDSSYLNVRNLSRELVFMAIYLGEDINIKSGVIDSKFNTQRDNQIRIIDGNYANLTLLNDVYEDKCIEWYEDDFKSRILYWVQEYPN